MSTDIFEKPVQLKAAHVDMFRRLRLSSMFSMLQEAAIEHTILLGCPREKTLDRGLLWVVSHHQAHIHRLPVYDEHLTLRTWPGRTMHLFFPRYCRLVDSQGKPVVETSSLWVLMDAKERKIAFPEKYDIEIPGEETGDEIPLPKRFQVRNTNQSAGITIPPSLVDMNGHLNNARYIDIVQDLLPFEWYQKEIREICVEYVSEVRLGQELLIRYAADQDRIFIAGETDRTVFRMRMEYSHDEIFRI